MVRGRAVRRGAPKAVLLLGLAAAACSVPNELNPVAIYNRISGNDDASRPAPPGLDRPTPNLASVPPRPERPPLTLRESITSSLVEDRSNSREPLQLRGVPAEGRALPAELSGEQPMPAAPPRRPALAAAPTIPWSEGTRQPRAQDRVTPAAAQPPPPEVPDEAPAPPPPELLGAPPRPNP